MIKERSNKKINMDKLKRRSYRHAPLICQLFSRYVLRFTRQSLRRKGVAVKKHLMLYIFAGFISSCTPWTQKQGMDLFVAQQNYEVMMEHKVDGFLESTSAVDLVGVKEVKHGVLEYSFVDKHALLFRPASEKCRFILVVEKKTHTIIDWRYNGNPNYCTSNP